MSFEVSPWLAMVAVALLVGVGAVWSSLRSRLAAPRERVDASPSGRTEREVRAELTHEANPEPTNHAQEITDDAERITQEHRRAGDDAGLSIGERLDSAWADED